MTAPESGGLSVALDASDLVAEVRGRASASLEAEVFRALPSSQLDLGDLVELATLIEQRLATGRFDGVVVTQGTDTIEESAFALDLLLESSEPIVVTGAMRAPDQPGSDVLANLLGAVETAASAVARGLGVLVVMNDEIHAARFVRKIHSSSPAAFASVVGPIGWITEGRARIALRPIGEMALPARPRQGPAAAVALVSVGIGDGGETVASLDPARIEGCVVEGLGGGHVPSRLVEPLATLASKIPVILASRTGAGDVLSDSYEFRGSERDLLRRGLASSAWLDARKARVLLSLLLRCGLDPSGVREAFTVLVRSGIASEPDVPGKAGR